MIGFNPAMYQNNDDGSVIKVVQVTKNNIGDVEEWARGFGHDILRVEDHDEELFTIVGENSRENYFEVDVLLKMFLAVDSDGFFFEFDDFTDQEDEYTRLG